MEWSKQETALVSIALVLAAALILFNALSAPPLASPTVVTVSTDLLSQAQSLSSVQSAVPSSHVSVASTAASVASTQKILLNQATAQQLTAIPGIGDTIAQRIVEYREKYGPFTSFEELLEIEGIGQKKLEEIQQWADLG